MSLIPSDKDPEVGDIYFWINDIEKDKKHNRDPQTHFRIILLKDEGNDMFMIYRNVKNPEKIIDTISVVGLKNSIRDGYIKLFKIR